MDFTWLRRGFVAAIVVGLEDGEVRLRGKKVGDDVGGFTSHRQVTR